MDKRSGLNHAAHAHLPMCCTSFPLSWRICSSQFQNTEQIRHNKLHDLLCTAKALNCGQPCIERLTSVQQQAVRSSQEVHSHCEAICAVSVSKDRIIFKRAACGAARDGVCNGLALHCQHSLKMLPSFLVNIYNCAGSFHWVPACSPRISVRCQPKRTSEWMCTSTPRMGCQNVYRPHLVVIMAMLASTGAGLHSQAFRLEALVALAGNSLRVVLRVAEQTSSRKRSLAPGHLTASSALQSVWSYQQ